ncbi:MAG: putative lipid II flippase FtsW [Chloroflexia bacterium]
MTPRRPAEKRTERPSVPRRTFRPAGTPPAAPRPPAAGRNEADGRGNALSSDDFRGLWPSLGSWREALRSPRPGPPDHWLLVIVGSLTLLGLVVLYSASFVVSTEQTGNPATYLGQQLLWLLLGLAGGLVAMRVDYRFWRRVSVPGMAVILLLLIAVLVLPSPLVEERNGARRWFSLGALNFQPSQAAFLVFVVYIADWLSKRGQKLRHVTYGLVPFAVILGLLAGLILLEPDMGTASVLVLVGGVVFLVAGADLKHFTLAGLLAGGIFFLLARIAPYRWNRLIAFLDPTASPHLRHNLIALGSGGLFGIGLGQGRQKFSWLPSAYTDSIFAVIGEEMGLLGCLLIAGLFLWLAYRGYTIAIHAPDRYGMLLGVGITTWLSFQALINMASTASLLPFSGMTLPLISYGGSSLVSCMTAIGLLLNISCHRKREDARVDLWRGDWWTRLPRPGRHRRPAGA